MDEQSGYSGDSTPEQRADHRVRGVLGQRLDGAPGQFGRVEVLGIAAAQVREPITGGGDVVGLQLASHGVTLSSEAVAAQYRPGGGGSQCGVRDRVVAGELVSGDSEGCDRGQCSGGEQRASGHGIAVDAALEPAHPAAEPRDRMVTFRIAEHCVGDGSGDEAQRMIHGRHSAEPNPRCTLRIILNTPGVVSEIVKCSLC